jgi:uncharacterized membrane protein
MKNTHVSSRYGEIDFARGIAILMMVIFHTVFDLRFFGIVPFSVSTGFWRIFAISTAFLFVFLVGVSLSISAANARKKLDRRDFILKFLFRGLMIFGLGLAITVVTWLYLGNGFIIFGILHLIGISIILSVFFLRFTLINLISGIAIIISGIIIQWCNGPIWLLWIGIHPESFYSVDYTPLLPWFGVVLIGIYVGKKVYPDGKRADTPGLIQHLDNNAVSFLGKHSLLIYILHQPLIILTIWVISGAAVFPVH